MLLLPLGKFAPVNKIPPKLPDSPLNIYLPSSIINFYFLKFPESNLFS